MRKFVCDRFSWKHTVHNGDNVIVWGEIDRMPCSRIGKHTICWTVEFLKKFETEIFVRIDRLSESLKRRWISGEIVGFFFAIAASFRFNWIVKNIVLNAFVVFHYDLLVFSSCQSFSKKRKANKFTRDCDCVCVCLVRLQQLTGGYLVIAFYDTPFLDEFIN